MFFRNLTLFRFPEGIDKRFGTGAVQTADHLGGAVIRTGSLALDVATGIGGLPRGRIVEFYGPEGAGKTALALCAIAEAQRAGGVCAFIDADQSIDPGWARKLGVRLDQLLVSQPENGNAALQIVETLIHTGVIDLVVVDSVPGLVPKVELDDEVVRTRDNGLMISLEVTGIDGITSGSSAITALRAGFAHLLDTLDERFSFYLHRMMRPAQAQLKPIHGQSFAADIDHMGFEVFVEMGEVGHNGFPECVGNKPKAV